MDEVNKGLLALWEKGLIYFFIEDGEFVSALISVPVPEGAVLVDDLETIEKFLNEEAHIYSSKDN